MKSNSPTGTKKAMNKTSKFLSMTILAVVGAIIAGCSSDDSYTDEAPQQPTNTDHIVTVTTTVGFDEGDGAAARGTTRALAADGTKTFVTGDRIAVVYTNTSDATVKVESETLASTDITESGKRASFTITLTNPKPNGSVKYIYPAAMAKDDGTVNYDALATQDGTLTSLGSNLDLAVYYGTLTGNASLPTSTTLTNQLAILALTLKNSAGTSDITNNTTRVTLSDGSYSYTVSRQAVAGPIYVAIRPTSSANIFVTATASPEYYVKSLNSKTYTAGNGYSVSWRMSLAGAFTVASGKQVYFAPGNLQLVGENTWKFADNAWKFFGMDQSNNHRDLFGWGTADNPNNTSQTYSDYKWNEWGDNVHVQAGIGTGWRTLSMDEWNYVLYTRTSSSTVFGTANARFAKATIQTDVGNGVKGLILFPDGVNIQSSEVTSTGIVNRGEEEWTTQCNSTQWTAIAAKGCVFLPAAGCRYGNQVQDVQGVSETPSGRYWSSTVNSSSEEGYVYTLLFHNNTVYMHSYYRYRGDAVRLVRPVE